MMDRITREKPYSDKTAEEIDQEIRDLIEEATRRARDIIKTNRALLEKLKDALLEHETLDADEVAAILDGMVLPETAKLY